MHVYTDAYKTKELPEDCLFDHTYIGDLIDQILLGKTHTTYTAQEAEQSVYVDTLKRGLPVTETRWHI